MALNSLRNNEAKPLASGSLDIEANDDADEGFVLVDSGEDLHEEDFEIIESHPPYSLPLAQISYDESDQGLGNSSHRVVCGNNPKDQSVHFLKFNDNEAMLYCESFMGHLYSMSLLYGVTRCYVRYDENDKPVALSSLEIPNFNTFKHKDSQLTQESLKDPAYRTRFIRLLAVLFRMHEDDAHCGNITTDLQIFDADCAFWDVTCKVKGGRPNVDNVLPGHLISRDPETAFQLHEQDIIHFPNITHAKPWYFPSLDAVATAYFSNNPFTPQETALVKKLETCPETLDICFYEFLDWMLDISQRFRPLAQLTIPGKLTVKGENVIKMYCAKNDMINCEYWAVLPKMPLFHDFLKRNSDRVIHEILVRCHIRNMRLIADKKNAAVRHEAFDNAVIDPGRVIFMYNELVHAVKRSQLMTFSFASFSIFGSVFARSEEDIAVIDEGKAKELTEKSYVVALKMMEQEAEFGTACWSRFTQVSQAETSKVAAAKSTVTKV
ncbi:hypothetical protein AQUSIP_09780 [Aquicella siphonis]|uniref:Uncharacterized protein n=1 Tax=Aquicella siphonis TaxID=254247 RepID=A0A5E4PGP3_9COXI|nr:hypothetical protein [Aquicella siphonis]VVC75688.1 hypothetical protein AQUSIP_09780 [Aquicella siphonis]